MVEVPVAADRWDAGSTDLHVREQGTTSATEEFVASFPQHLWEPLGIKATRTPGQPDWTIRASDRVGIMRVDVGGTAAHIRITPKLPDLDLFFLADWAYGSSSTTKSLLSGRAELDAVRSEPAACLLAWYLAEAVAFATRWVRRGYVTREEELVGRVRGRIDTTRYIRNSLASARPHVVPCRYTEPSDNTRPNQYLKLGVRRAAALAHLVPNAGARRFLLELSRRGLALLASVDDVQMTPRHGRRLNLAGPLRHYRPITDFTTALLEGTYVGTEVGAHGQQAILWPLNLLYEQSLRNILDGWHGGVLDKRSLRATVVAPNGKRLGSSRVTPDFVLSTDSTALALDAKYKDVRVADELVTEDSEVVDVAPTARERVRLRRSDVYQAVAYGRHDGLRPAVVCLIYPVTLAPDEPYPDLIRVEGFDPVVNVLFMDVGPRAAGNVAALYAALDKIAAATPAQVGAV
ncbi:hypothetical protein ACFWH7_16635 [Cellulosimicrobium cellulans]|uniref:5-methylcytosine restriction system specificity protein McrC n=1 Tax=Cellulosimicrobium cellulans TaxID=1710 RepID=UPI003664ECF3